MPTLGRQTRVAKRASASFFIFLILSISRGLRKFAVAWCTFVKLQRSGDFGIQTRVRIKEDNVLLSFFLDEKDEFAQL